MVMTYRTPPTESRRRAALQSLGPTASAELALEPVPFLLAWGRARGLARLLAGVVGLPILGFAR